MPLTVSERQYVTLPLVEREELGAGYQLLRFRAAVPLVARPGQFVMVRPADWPVAPLLPRPMSLLGGGAEPRLLVKVVGEGTRRMAGAQAGERFALLGPLGRPWPWPKPGSAPLLVAGGVGLAPLLFLARELARQPEAAGAGQPRARALYGGRTAADLPLADELGAIAELGLATEDGSRGTRGLVTALLDPALADIARAGLRPMIYACGPQAMMAAVARLAAERALSCQVSLEARMACGCGCCLGCAVPRAAGGYLYACADGPCVDAAQVGWDRAEALV
ncbi:MAG: dihydroorotate dehydrogenase electron transfer subunit [Deltaproteobacteria bacterium]|nr:dihydroorotate dehydrogenase electron transfer subunit [Deltaproteobacteria bacterium]